jgi:hypothetical protein
MFLGSSELPGVQQLWKTRASSEHNFFGWLALLDYCWTGEWRQRHGLQDGDNCALCDQNPQNHQPSPPRVCFLSGGVDGCPLAFWLGGQSSGTGHVLG